jgi:hypothetical protein
MENNQIILDSLLMLRKAIQELPIEAAWQIFNGFMEDEEDNILSDTDKEMILIEYLRQQEIVINQVINTTKK